MFALMCVSAYAGACISVHMLMCVGMGNSSQSSVKGIDRYRLGFAVGMGCCWKIYLLGTLAGMTSQRKQPGG